MELLGDVGHVECRFFRFGDSVCVGEVTLVMWKLTSFRSEIVLVSVQDGCTVGAKCTIGSEIVSDAPDGTQGDKAQVEACYGPIGGSAYLNAR